MTWVIFTFLAAFSQSWRNALQSQLSQSLTTSGVTLARFLWAAPLSLLYLWSLYQWAPSGSAPVPKLSDTTLLYVCLAALMQIIATALMVLLFKQQNFAVGAGLAKNEATIAALLGVLFFGVNLSAAGWLGVVLGGVAVFMLSAPQGWQKVSLTTALLGLSCSSAFALTSLWIREASLSLNLPYLLSAAWVLAMIINLQTLLLLGYLCLFDRTGLKRVFAHPKPVLLTSIASFIGSFGWFNAMSLQSVPYVKTLGQVEVFFTILIAVFWLKQPPKMREVSALLLIAIAAVLVMWQ
ncbi:MULTISPECIES: multidrug transporter [unclassified Vibrio]|uniref:Multidrug transporter n=1 Tax=Vibrio sp. HB236076 TaxID=3232307 RepID=A0AB39H9Z5_9VIBR|nr:multidrug transporter [Vibrio sp. HB161653]MDP5255345.1 multidrug transporter [Vibrio sp. HB161653]